MPTNISPSTATEITSLLFTETTDPTTAPTSPLTPTCGSDLFGLWWVYTPPTGTNAIGLTIASTTSSAEYQPGLSVWTGTLPLTLTQLDECCYTFNDPSRVQINVEPGTAYYFLVSLAGGSGPVGTANLTITVESLLNAAPAGSLLVTSDIPNQATIILAQTDGLSLRAVGMASSEQGDFLAAGQLAIMAEDPTDANTAVGIELWAADLSTRITTVTSCIRANQLSLSPIRSNRNATWYVASVLSAAPAIINTVSALGAVGGTSWTLPANSANMKSMAVTQNGAILYYANEVNAEPIYAYDLVNDVALPDFVAGAANVRRQRDLWVLANGDVLAVQRSTAVGTVFTVKHYDDSGALLFTYPISGNFQSNPRMGLSGDETTFVVMSFVDGDTSRFETFTVGNIVATDTFDVDQNDNNGGGPLWGPSQSCPMLMLPVDVPAVEPPPGPGTARMIRRVRQFLLPSSPQNFRMHIPDLTVLAQTGIGLSDPDDTGYNPQLMLQVSKDGGKSYLPEQWVSAGRQGDYTARMKFTRTPNDYRAGVARIVATDPVDWTLVDVTTSKIEEKSS